jgi:KUP system potassium uptake protein
MKDATLEAQPQKSSSLTKPLTLTATIAALGVVFGDIGTSPLYAFRECLRNGINAGATPEQVIIPALSMIIWALICVVTIKYVLFMMEANDDGEGGIMTLVSLASAQDKLAAKKEEAAHPHDRNQPHKRKHRNGLILLGVFGTALLFGDGVITPAISVLSALEGVKELGTHTATGQSSPILQTISSPNFVKYFIPTAAVVILFGIFCLQKRGSGKVGLYFGPITLIWFICIATSGAASLIKNHEQATQLMSAFNPLVAVGFLMDNPGLGMVVLGAVFLSVTGAEALYADMGHFGQKPIRAGWYFIVFPALILNYLGQGAWALASHERIIAGGYNPFFNMAPSWAQLPLIIIATLAAIIASQALISGAFSTTMQAIQLNFLPRMRIEQTSDEESGQIYIPIINWLLMIGSIYLVLEYKSSEHLASAYGIAVSLTMLVTTILFGQYLRQKLKIPAVTAYLLVAPLILMELLFVVGNLPKIFENGWLPLAAGFLVYYIMSVWNKGRIAMRQKLLDTEQGEDFSLFLDSVEDRFQAGKLSRVKGTAVYLAGMTNSVPMALAHNLKHNKSLHDHIIVITLTIDENRAYVNRDDRVTFNLRGKAFCNLDKLEFPSVLRVTGKFGFREQQDIFSVLEAAYTELGIKPNPMEVTYFLSRETIVRDTSKNFSLNTVQEKLFEVLNRNALSATAYFNLPPGRVVELGMQVEL